MKKIFIFDDWQNRCLNGVVKNSQTVNIRIKRSAQPIFIVYRQKDIIALMWCQASIQPYLFLLSGQKYFNWASLRRTRVPHTIGQL